MILQSKMFFDCGTLNICKLTLNTCTEDGLPQEDGEAEGLIEEYLKTETTENHLGKKAHIGTYLKLSLSSMKQKSESCIIM